MYHINIISLTEINVVLNAFGTDQSVSSLLLQGLNFLLQIFLQLHYGYNID
jgi:hypothetical protein